MSVPSIEALEAQFGNIGVADDFDGEIEPDDEPNGRTAVVYDDDPLLASPPPGGLSELASRAVHPGGGGGGGEALLARLEAMAAQLEAESGEPEPGIRAQISTLRAVLTGQKEEVKVQARRLAGMDAAGATAEASAAAERVEEGLARVDAAVSADPEATGLLGELLSSDAALASTWARKEQDGEEERGGGEDGEHGGEGDNSSP